MLLVLTVLLGFVYPLAVTGIAQVAFPWQANGSLVSSTGEHVTSRDDAVGSLLIGQAFDGPEWFHPRPSAAGDGYDTLASAGSNLGPLNEDLLAPSRSDAPPWPTRRASTPPTCRSTPPDRRRVRASTPTSRRRTRSSRSPASRGSGGSRRTRSVRSSTTPPSVATSASSASPG